jgi:hypothetical protein
VSGRPLRIVHRDVSPQNVLLSHAGEVKLVDFGIAKATMRVRQTAVGVIKGKYYYMSPEQAWGDPLDHRSDIFSLGIVLYEITVGRRLFRGPAQDVVRRLVEAQVEPPTFARRNFPPALESIVMRTLEKHPEDRYQTAYDLADDLESFLRDEKLHSGPVRIARYLDMLAIASGGTRRPELISEAEARRGDGDDLDFDSQVFDGFAPREGAPGPEQAPLWEDVEQNEADVAAALHMELAELRSLRTPVPMRPSGMIPVGASQLGIAPAPDSDDDVAAVTNPVRRMKTGEIYGDDEDDDTDVTDKKPRKVTSEEPALVAPALRPTAAPKAEPKPEPTPSASKPAEPPAARASIPPLRQPVIPATPLPGAQIGAAFLARSAPPKLPWVLVATLGMAVLGLVAYIVMR